MGYYTDYEIEVDNYRQEDEINALLHEQTGYALEIGRTYYGIKWYDCEADMKIVSKAFPNVLFTVHGDGGDGGDLWRMYVRDGKVQRTCAELRYEEFDERKLN